MIAGCAGANKKWMIRRLTNLIAYDKPEILNHRREFERRVPAITGYSDGAVFGILQARGFKKIIEIKTAGPVGGGQGHIKNNRAD